jgi:hypothetical protein
MIYQFTKGTSANFLLENFEFVKPEQKSEKHKQS